MNTNQGKRMDQVRIAELRLHEKHLRASGQMVGACLGECLDALEATRAELAALRGQVGGVVPGELEALREIVRLLDEARERYAKHPRGAGGQRMADEIDELLCRLYEMGAHPAVRERDEARAELATAREVIEESMEARRASEAEGGALNHLNNEIDRLRAELAARKADGERVVVPEPEISTLASLAAYSNPADAVRATLKWAQKNATICATNGKGEGV